MLGEIFSEVLHSHCNVVEGYPLDSLSNGNMSYGEWRVWGRVHCLGMMGWVNTRPHGLVQSIRAQHVRARSALLIGELLNVFK